MSNQIGKDIPTRINVNIEEIKISLSEIFEDAEKFNYLFSMDLFDLITLSQDEDFSNFITDIDEPIKGTQVVDLLRVLNQVYDDAC